MTPKQQIEALAARVKELSVAEGSHDWWHIWRVWRLAELIARAEGADVYMVTLAALCHDLEDWKYPHETTIRPLLGELGVEKTITEQVLEICQRISFKGVGVADGMPSLEGRVVQDADRLDAIGAIGIARCFAYGGSRGRPLYDPREVPVLHKSFSEYQNSNPSSLSHFYEKLLWLKDRLHTPTARKLATERHRYTLEFVERFRAEWEGEQ
ncbi:HD domain-containing protein [Meiothermus hypogaeus]|uniref:Phosphohydrolase n=2 Tax=Meiothermus hypogaeus TaxID=884155 RepID=A0A511R3C3_9DEIN|nr:HD domain-containing protein [Meiothermus hypogaeus]RIH76353.1 HD domain protein [Meiothermus hypogaeus]GEM84109.1 phosphohydrolase [Meiothermus hypogaeus NBRC 106114]